MSPKEIVEKYTTKVIENAKKDLIALMQYEGIKRLAYRTYCPSFNDGDPCETSILFLVEPNFLFDAYYTVIFEDGSLGVFDGGYSDYEDGDEELREKFFSCVPKEHLEFLDKFYEFGFVERYEEAEKLSLVRKYELENFEKAMCEIALILLEPNTEGSLTLTEDGQDLVKTAHEYYCD